MGVRHHEVGLELELLVVVRRRRLHHVDSNNGPLDRSILGITCGG